MKKESWVALAVSAVLCASLGTVLADGEDDALTYWPNWRGPLFTGIAPKADPPVEWSESKNLRWKVELPGPGHATPVVWGERIFVLSAVKTDKQVEAAGEPPSQEAPHPPPAQQQRRGRRSRPPRVKPTHIHRFVVSALDRKSGETIWETVVREEVPHEPGHQTASQASASPVTDGERLYAFFGSRGLYCLDMDGKVLWEADLGTMKTRNEFGEGASPALHGDTLVINWDHEGDSFIVALNKLTGEQRWKVPRDEVTTWSTPLVIEDGDKTLVVVSATKRVRAYDIDNGDVVWEVAGLGLNCVPTPVVDQGLIFVMSGYREPAAMAVRYPGAKGDITGSDRVLWRIETGTSYVPSPVLTGGKVYFLGRFGNVLSSYDLKSGKPQYGQQRLEGLGNIYASLVGAAGRIYALDQDGNAVVFREGAEFEILATNALDDRFDASPVIAGDELYLRGHKYLYCVAGS